MDKLLSLDIRIVTERETKSCQIEGSADIDEGVLSGRLIEAGLKLHWNEFTLLSAFTFTGCPLAARTDSPMLNPWRHTGGAYRGKRNLKSDEFEARSHLQARTTEGGLHMDLELTIAGVLPALSHLAYPFQERLTPAAVGVLEGVFDVEWMTRDRRRVTGRAQSHYELDINWAPVHAWRNISIGVGVENG